MYIIGCPGSTDTYSVFPFVAAVGAVATPEAEAAENVNAKLHACLPDACVSFS